MVHGSGPVPTPGTRFGLNLLGSFQFTRNRQALVFPTRKIHLLLAYLTLRRGVPQSRQQLAYLLYPDSTDAQARTNLRTVLHRLHATLPEIDLLLDLDSQILRWKDDIPLTLDVTEFERAIARADQAERQGDAAGKMTALQSAAAIYRGDLMPDCYDDWIAPERERLQRMMQHVLETLLTLLDQQGDPETVIGYAQRLLAMDPVNEAAYLTLMRLYAARGDRGSALRTYHTCVTRFREEADIEPPGSVRALYSQLLATPATPAQPLLRQAPLIGREAEWQSLRAGWARAARGEPRFMLISGEAGIGKSRLTEELLTWTQRQGATAVVTNCYATEGDLAYAPIVMWLRDPALARLRQSLESQWLKELSRLLPEIRTERPEIEEPLPLREAWQRQRLFEALARATLNGSSPLLLAIEDLQWSDRDTLAWLHYLLRFDSHTRLLVVGTARSEELDENSALRDLLDDLRHDDRLREIALGTLSRQETFDLAQHLDRSLDASRADLLYADTEGNPLFVVETVRATQNVSDSAPGTERASGTADSRRLTPKVQAVIAHRLSRLSPAAQAVLGASAVIGRSFSFEVLVRAAEGDEDSLVHGLDELWQRRIVREQGTHAYDFTHDKLRAVAYANLTPARRRLLHRRVAHALEQLYAENPDAVSAQLALHYERAGMVQPAILAYGRAAETAKQLYANADALNLYQRALNLIATDPPEMNLAARRQARTQLSAALADVLYMLGSYEDARREYQEALEPRTAPEPFARVELYRKIGNCWRELHRYPEALEAYSAAEMALDADAETPVRRRWQAWCDIQIERFNVHYWLADIQGIRRTVSQLQPVIEEHGTPEQRARLYQVLAIATVRLARYRGSEESVAYGRAFLAAIEEAGDAIWLPSAHFQLGFLLLWNDELAEAEHEMVIGLNLAEQRGDISLLARALTYLAVVHRLRDKPGAAAAFAERALEVATRTQMNDYIGAAHGNLAWLAWRNDDLALAREHGLLALDAWSRLSNTYMFQWVALWPLIGVAFQMSEYEQVVTFTRKLLDDSQQVLPAILENDLNQALEAAANGGLAQASPLLDRSLRTARNLNFL